MTTHSNTIANGNVASSLTSWWRNLAAELDRGAHTHSPLYVVAMLFLAMTIAESFYIGVPLDMEMVTIFRIPVLFVLFVMVFLRLFANKYRPDAGIDQHGALGEFRSNVVADFFHPRRLANAIHASAFMSIFMIGFAFMKVAIPSVVAFSWDEKFMQIDQQLHFGWHPFEILQPLFGFPVVTFATNFIYNMWFVVMFSCWFWQGFSRHDNPLRLQFLLSFALTWSIGGGILATVFSSGGPCYYGNLVGGSDPFAPLTSYLASANETWPIWALNTQAELWSSYVNGEGVLKGISAMPSMHVASSTLFVLLGFSKSRKMGWSLVLFAVMIFLGSVHLGWHYAIDGYAGAVLAVLFWKLSGMMISWHRRPLTTVAGQLEA